MNTYDEERLADIFYLYGELKNSRKIAAALVKARAAHKIETTQDFIGAVETCSGVSAKRKTWQNSFRPCA